MRLPTQGSAVNPSVEQHNVKPVDVILKAQASKHGGALHGLISNGGKVSVDGFIIEIIADASLYRTIQIYECAKGITPRVQQYQRTKTKIVKQEVYKKPKTQQETIKVDTNVEDEDLF